MQTLSTPAPLPRTAGWAALGVLTALVVVGVVTELPRDAAVRSLAALVAVGAGSLALLGPPRTAAPALALSGAAVAVVCVDDPSNVGWFATVVLVGWCALTRPLPVTVGYWLALLVVFAAQATLGRQDPGWFAWIAGTAFSAFGCVAGRRQHELVVALREAQAGLEQRAQVEERARIARELHDVIAHSMTVSLMHVSAARLALDGDPGDAERALAEAERLGRASLDEVRHAVGTLRTGPAEATADPTRPLPGSTDVPGLIAGFTAAGADVRLDLTDTVVTDLSALPATVGLAAYRILQEALTNAAKHAPGRPVTVHLTVVGGTVRLDVDSAGAPRSGSGLGLVGMRERAASVGGVAEAGPGGSGWRVHAELPVRR